MDKKSTKVIQSILKETYIYAYRYATDPSTQNAALILKDNNVIACGANHFPKNVAESPARWERPLKYSYVEHAERNAIFDAVRRGVSTVGTTMVCPWFACDNCARAIIQAGIIEVIGHQSPVDWTPDHWKDSINIALNMLKEAGVNFWFYNGKIFENDELKIRFNGELKSP